MVFFRSIWSKKFRKRTFCCGVCSSAKKALNLQKNYPDFHAGIKPIDLTEHCLQQALKPLHPFITGTVASVLTSPLGQEAADFIIGEEAFPTPETYSKMRAGEAAADVVSFSPYAYLRRR